MLYAFNFSYLPILHLLCVIDIFTFMELQLAVSTELHLAEQLFADI